MKRTQKELATTYFTFYKLFHSSATLGKKIATLLFLCFISFSAVSCFAEQGDLPLQQVAERDTFLQSRQWKELSKKMFSLYLQGDLKGAIKVGEQCRLLVIENGATNTKAYSELLQALGACNLSIGFIEKGREQLQESLTVAENINTPPAHLANIQKELGKYYLLVNKFKEAEKFLALAGKNFKHSNQTSGIIFAQYVQFAALLERIYHNDKKKALELFEKALEITRESDAQGKAVLEASILYNMADTYVMLDNNEKALELLSKTIRIYNRTNPKNPEIMFPYYLLGRIYTNIQDYKTAMDFYEKSLSIAQKSVAKNHELISKIYAGMGALYFVTEKYNAAEESFQKAIDIRVYIYGENTLKNVVSFANLSYLYYLKKEYSKALEKSEFGLSLYKKNNYAPDKIYLDILDTRLMIFQKLGKSIEAQKCAELIKKYSSKTKN